MSKLFTLFLIAIYFPLYLSGQGLVFEPAFTNKQIPQVPIALLQDSKGFIWVGTTDGVYRYDGQDVLEFRHDPTDSTTISNNYVKAIHEDRKGNIWLGTRYGLNCYDPKLEKISRYLKKGGDQEGDENYIHSIIEDHKGKIWYGTYNGLFQLDPQDLSLNQFVPELEQDNKLSHELIWSVYEDSQQRIWAGTHLGFTVFKNDGSFKFQPYYGELNHPSGLVTDRVFEIIEQADSTIWLSSYDGIFQVIENNDSLFFQRLSHEKDNPNSLSDNRIFAFASGGANKIWAGTWAGGLQEIILPKNEKEAIKIIKHRDDPSNSSSISMDRVEAVMTDQSGLLWVGTGKRVDKASNNAHKFKTLYAEENQPGKLSHNLIKVIFKDSYGNLWIGTYKGLNFLSAENLKNKHYEFERFTTETQATPYNISHNLINGISEDSRGYLWINTFYGLNYIHIPTF